MTTTQTTCQCCGGDLPSRDIWEANRDNAGDCDGSVDARGRCRAFSDDSLWAVMRTYSIHTDACSQDIEAASLDVAAAEFAADEGIRNVRTAADLARHIERVGGWLTIADESGEALVEVK